MQQIDVQTTLRHSLDACLEDVAATLIEWLSDICECHVAGDPDLTTNVLAYVLQEERSEISPIVGPDLDYVQCGIYARRDGSLGRNDSTDGIKEREIMPPTELRLDWLFHVDNRLWKRPKLQMRMLYSRVMNVHPSCLEFMSTWSAVESSSPT